MSKLSWTFSVLRGRPRNRTQYLGLRLRHRSIGFWQKLQIELHSDCNRDCGFCPRFGDRSGVRKDAEGKAVRVKMPTEQVLSIIDQAHALGYRGVVGLHRLSEATLDPRFLDIYNYIRKRGMVFHDATNGDVLQRKPELCAAIDHPDTEIIFGLYDATTEDEREEEKRFWRSRFKHASVRFSEPVKKLVLRKNSQAYELAEKDPAVLDMPCYATNELLIRYDGNVNLCCQDDMCEFHLGNVFETPIEQIWWSDKRAEIVRTLRRPGGRHRLAPCSTCYAGAPSRDIDLNERLIRTA
jgi:radical SAM protein with 4Fe4S-binding SPASM domain